MVRAEPSYAMMIMVMNVELHAPTSVTVYSSQGVVDKTHFKRPTDLYLITHCQHRTALAVPIVCESLQSEVGATRYVDQDRLRTATKI